MEASLGSSTLAGLGYAFHDIGIFLNVFEDHIGNSSRISSREDILKAKSFIAERCRPEGTLVLNFDDELVMRILTDVSRASETKAIFFGLDVDVERAASLRADADVVTVQDGVIVYHDRQAGSVTEVVAVKDISWTFSGLYRPSIYNLLAVVSGLIAFGRDKLPELGDILRRSRFDPYGGRLTQLRAKNGTLVIADYAHEKKSLQEMAGLAKQLTGPGGKVIGVIRLAYDRSDELIKDTGRAIATSYDHLVVYDKIDGYWRQPKPREEMQFKRFPQVVGRVSELLAGAISEVNPNCDRILREDEAIKRAATLAGPNDVVVVIVNDDIKRSVDFIVDKFEADFI